MARRRTFMAASLAAVMLAGLIVSAGGAVEGAPTTLDQTIVPAEGGAFEYGSGQPRVTRSLGWRQKSRKGRPLAGFKQLSDLHVVDEESPGRLEYFSMCESDPRLSSAYRPHEAMTLQVGDAMLRRLGAIARGPATGTPLTFTVSTGDNIDNNQLNELRWFIDLVDGGTVDPNSGGSAYEGYTQEHFSGALNLETLEMAQEPFDAHGAGQPWYAVLGNHDGLVQGNVRETPQFQLVVQQGKKVFLNVDEFDRCPDGPGDNEHLFEIFQDAYLNEASAVTADSNRRFLSRRRLIDEFFITTGKPRGHGLAGAPKDPTNLSSDGTKQRAGYYSFAIASRVRGISLDTINYGGGASGILDDPQFKWLQRELRKHSRRWYTRGGDARRNRKAMNRLIVLFSHHSSRSLSNLGLGLDEQYAENGAPFHCFRTEQAEGCGGEGLKSLLQRYPNVIAWVNGHEHNNAVRPFHAPATTNKARGFWEINTASHIDWPQQSRLFEIAWRPGRRADSVFIYATTVDHGAPLVPDVGSQTPLDYLASISRVESYHDACVRGRKKCDAVGEAKDQNVKLVLKAPFRISR